MGLELQILAEHINDHLIEFSLILGLSFLALSEETIRYHITRLKMARRHTEEFLKLMPSELADLVKEYERYRDFGKARLAKRCMNYVSQNLIHT